MNHLIFKENPDNRYSIALLIKESSFKQRLLEQHYINPLKEKGIKEDSIIALSLSYNDKGKAPVKLIKECLSNIIKACEKLEVNTILVADTEYFKKLTGKRKAEPYYGYVQECTISTKPINVILSVNYQSLFYNPDIVDRLTLSLTTLVNHIQGNTIEMGKSIIHSAQYPSSLVEIQNALEKLHEYPAITCDIETFHLKHYKSGIGTIAFAWNKHEGVAFCVDYRAMCEPYEGIYGEQVLNIGVRHLLKKFFTEYAGKLIWHNISFDVTIAIAQLWMAHITDLKGLYAGLEVMTRNFDCTQIITYLATNSCSGNTLSLKYNAHEFTGNYAQEDINDICRIPVNQLLEYNLIDCLATWYVYEKNYPIMVQDQQEEVYLGLFKDSLITIIQMQLTGMPMCMDQVAKVEKELQEIKDTCLNTITNNSLIHETTKLLKIAFINKDFTDRKNKAKNPDKLKPKLYENIDLQFNVSSGSQLAVLLYEVMQLPIIEKTKTGLPSTDDKTLNSLLNHTDNTQYLEIINSIIEFNKVEKILSTFIPAFKEAQLGIDGIYYLFGSYKLGGTISGRLSSSSPNLQNLPSGSKYGKLVKKCFKGNQDWLYVGADFSSLEDRINALLTKDPNKIKIYTDGYCGHSLRAYKYFGNQMPDIRQVNSDVRCFKAKVGNTDICFTENDLITYQGVQYNGVAFYEKITHQKL